MWSTSPAARNSRITVGPPPMRTSWPPAASRAVSSASAGDAARQGNGVPPSISIGGGRVEEVERRAALHLDRRARVMGEDEDRCVERRVGTPRALPLRVLVPSGRAELPGTHDLGADPRSEQPQEGVIDAAGPARLAEQFAAPPGSEHPLVQPFAGVAERCLEALTLAGGETVERDGDVL